MVSDAFAYDDYRADPDRLACMDALESVISACGMSELSKYRHLKLVQQVSARSDLLADCYKIVTSHRNDLIRLMNNTQSPDISVLSRYISALSASNGAGYASPEHFESALLEYRQRRDTLVSRSVLGRILIPSVDSFDALLEQLEYEIGFVLDVSLLLDKLNTIDHVFLGSIEFQNKYSPESLSRPVHLIWSDYISDRPAKDVRLSYFCPAPVGHEDEVSRSLVKATLGSRRGFTIERVLNAMTWAAENGWFIVFDTLTFSDENLRDFHKSEHALRDHFRNVGRLVLQAEGRAMSGSYSDCFEYFCVPEFGGKFGRLHFHAIYLMRTLPINTHCPNQGKKRRINRLVLTLCNLWPWGYNYPYAVRYQGDAFTRAGWLWPMDKKSGKAIPVLPVVATGFYVAKYVNKKHSNDIELKLKEESKWSLHLKENFGLLPKGEYRVRMSRTFGMRVPSMESLSLNSLIEITKLDSNATPLRRVLRQNARKQLRLRLGTVYTLDILDAKPKTLNLLASLRVLTRDPDPYSLQNFIASMTPNLTLLDVSDETRKYLEAPFFDPLRRTVKPAKCGGPK